MAIKENRARRKCQKSLWQWKGREEGIGHVMGKKISEKGNKQEYREEWKKHWVSIRNKNRQGRDKTDMEGENENVRGRFCQQASTQTSSHVKLSLVNNRIFKIKTCFLHADFYLTVNLSKSFIYQLSMTQLTVSWHQFLDFERQS